VLALATDSFGRLYVSEYTTKQFRIQVRDVNGKWYQLFDTGQDAEVFQGGVVYVDCQDVVYLVTDGPPRILRWTPQSKTKANIRPSKDAK